MLALDILNANIPLKGFHVFTTFLSIGFFLSFFYLLYSGLLFHLFFTGNHQTSLPIQNRKVSKQQVFFEIRSSIQCLFCIAFLLTLTIIAWRLNAFPLLYFDFFGRGPFYALLSFIILLLFQDISFYFTHRLMHKKSMYRFHKIHHASQCPSPFAAHSMHPLEACLHYLRIPVFIFCVPCSMPILILGELFSIIVNNYGHLNHEPRLPAFIRRLQIKRLVITSGVFHNIHHQKHSGNYGFYLLIWDKLFRTYRTETHAQLLKKV